MNEGDALVNQVFVSYSFVPILDNTLLITSAADRGQRVRGLHVKAAYGMEV